MPSWINLLSSFIIVTVVLLLHNISVFTITWLSSVILGWLFIEMLDRVFLEEEEDE